VSNRPVVVSTRADEEIESIGRWWAQNRSAQQAKRWVDGILRAIEKLAATADRCSKATENDQLPFEVRQLNFGLGRRPTHRVLFTLRPECIYVLTVIHVAQDAVGLEDI
jgi:plasmid stabilization system protein ParE